MARDRVVFPKAVRRALLAHARRVRPRECCGLLVGRGTTVQFAVALPNVDTRPARFKIDDRDHLDLRRLLRGFRPPLTIVGVYHSHPRGPARPSPSDVAEAFYPEWLHVIVGLGGTPHEVRAFRIRRARAQVVHLVTRG
jgi:proteasome lid subunit RPN8/RPN11